MVKEAQIFNPLFVIGNSDTEIVTRLHLLADKFVHFRYYHFTDDFIVKVKK